MAILPQNYGEYYKNNVSNDSWFALQRVDSQPTVDPDAVDIVCDLPIERCMRILPHDQNGGAFFIAVFQKLAPLPCDLCIFILSYHLFVL